MTQVPPSWIVVGCADVFTSDWSKYQHTLEIVVQTPNFSVAPIYEESSRLDSHKVPTKIIAYLPIKRVRNKKIDMNFGYLSTSYKDIAWRVCFRVSSVSYILFYSCMRSFTSPRRNQWVKGHGILCEKQ